MRRRVRVAVAAAAAVGVLATGGCSPGNWPTIAVLLVDGEPSVLAEPCPSDKLTLMLLSEVTGGNADDWPQSRVQGDRPLGDGETVRLLSPPDGWRNSRSDVTRIEPGRTYSLQAWGAQISFSVEFTLSDLRALGPDEVWASTDGESNRALPREDFERAANSDCAR